MDETTEVAAHPSRAASDGTAGSATAGAEAAGFAVMAFGAVILGFVVLAAIWVVAKIFLHSQLSWLIWTPVVAALGGGLAGTRRLAWAGYVIAPVAVLLVPVAGPIVVGVQQHRGEEAYVREVRSYLRAAPQTLSDRDLIKAGWEFCDGLDAVGDAGDAYSQRDPAEVVASFALQIANSEWDSADQAEMEHNVRSADRHLCSLASPFAFPGTRPAPSLEARVPASGEPVTAVTAEPSSTTPSTSPSAETAHTQIPVRSSPKPSPVVSPSSSGSKAAAPAELTCPDVNREVRISVRQVKRATDAGLEVWPRVRVENHLRSTISVAFSGSGRASSPLTPESPLEMNWGVDDPSLTILAGHEATQDLGQPFGEVLYVPPGGKVLAFSLHATADAGEDGLAGCVLNVVRQK